ncbi:MAG: hypothetical protein WC584_03105 [Candidatus Pacearchaeota archaeon]
MNKRGGEKLLSVWWFFVLTVVGVGIVVSVLMFYSAEEDTRSLESEILYNKIVDCVVDNGVLIQGISNKEFDLTKTCNLNEKVINEEKLFYIKINILDENGKSLREPIVGGSGGFPTQCEIQKPDENGKTTGAKHYAKCFERTINILYGDGKNGKLGILTASNNLGRKIGATENV